MGKCFIYGIIWHGWSISYIVYAKNGSQFIVLWNMWCLGNKQNVIKLYSQIRGNIIKT